MLQVPLLTPGTAPVIKGAHFVSQPLLFKSLLNDLSPSTRKCIIGNCHQVMEKKKKKGGMFKDRFVALQAFAGKLEL